MEIAESKLRLMESGRHNRSRKREKTLADEGRTQEPKRGPRKGLDTGAKVNQPRYSEPDMRCRRLSDPIVESQKVSN